MGEIIASTYEIKKKIGAGGGGVVYLARHLRLQKDVVLKADKRKITTNEALLRREVNVLKDLSHQNIPQVYDFFIENDTVYTVIDFIQGESLDKPLKRGEHYPQWQIIKWGRQLLGALAYLHSPTHGDPPRGYVHSDIKPANLMRTPNGDICLIDFNIALAIGEESVIGLSAGYASPEHYGLDYSSEGDETTQRNPQSEKVYPPAEGNTLGESVGSSESRRASGDDSKAAPDAGGEDAHLGANAQKTAPKAGAGETSLEVEEDAGETSLETEADAGAASIEAKWDAGETSLEVEADAEKTSLETEADGGATAFEAPDDGRDAGKEASFTVPESPESDGAPAEPGTMLEDGQEQSGNIEAIRLSSLQINATVREEESKKPAKDGPGAASNSAHSGTGGKRRIMPDVRSDIYSVGATLYHLLSGVRPAKDAKDVIPLSKDEYSPLVVDIITKAMQPNPNLRYQTADEMLAAFERLRLDDPRVVRLKRARRLTYGILTLAAVLGVAASFVGLKRIQTVDRWQTLVEYSKNSLAEGDVSQAVSYAMQAIPDRSSLLTPQILPDAQRALTDALGVYDLSNGYRSLARIELPAEPQFIALSPDGKTVSCISAGELTVYDTETREALYQFPAVDSAMAQVVYLDNNTIFFAGAKGLTAVELSHGTELWVGEMATGIAVSGDGAVVAAVYRDESHATVYSAADGSRIGVVDFGGRAQKVLENDLLADTNDNILTLNDDGSLLFVSFSDGSLVTFSTNGTSYIEWLPQASGYGCFEGGAFENYFAFSAYDADVPTAIFVSIDTDTIDIEAPDSEEVVQNGFQNYSERAYSVQTDADGIYVNGGNILVSIDPLSGKETALVKENPDNIRCFAVSDGQALIAVEGAVRFYDRNAAQMDEFPVGSDIDFLQLSSGIAAAGSIDSPFIRLFSAIDRADRTLLEYDVDYAHDEARLSADEKTIMLFSHRGFRLYDVSGELINETELPEPGQVRDEQYRRDGLASWLEVTYNDGEVLVYSAENGELLRQETASEMDDTLTEVFQTDEYEIIAPLHGAPEVHSLKTGKLFCTIEEDARLTYIRQIGSCIIAQYISENYYYGQLMDAKCRVLADLPYLCDVKDGTLIFDYPSGQIRTSRIFTIKELTNLAKEYFEGGNQT